MKLYNALIILVVYLIFLCIIYFLHVQFFRVDVVFYSAVFDALLSGIFIILIFRYINRFIIFNSFEKTQLIAICLLLGYSLAISVPTVIDRSLSFYILEKIKQRGGGIQQSRFEEIFAKEYAKEHRLVDVRLTEQQESGTVKIENGCVKLTKRGEAIAAFSRFFRQNMLPKQRLLMGSYSDVLTDPFRDSEKDSDYKCQ
jgi:hypothetical protein